jgi:hypothetical protein
MPEAKDITVEMDENGLRLMGQPIKEPVPLEVLNSLLGAVPRRIDIDRKPWEKPATRHTYIYDASGLQIWEDIGRKRIYDLQCFFQVDRSYDWRKTIAEFSGRATICGVPLRAGMEEKEVLATVPAMKRRVPGWLRGEFNGQTALLVFARNKEALAGASHYRRKTIPETLESLVIGLSPDERWGTGRLPPEGDI